MRGVREAPAAVPRPRAERGGAGRGAAPSRRLQLLRQELPLRGRVAPLRPAGGRRGDDAAAEGEALGASHAAGLGPQQAALGGPVMTTSRCALRPPGSGLTDAQPSWDASRWA